jgi:DNA-binding NarL/FixJ family response regulator
VSQPGAPPSPPSTPDSSINHLFTKIGARDRAQAVTYAYRHDLAPRPAP